MTIDLVKVAEMMRLLEADGWVIAAIRGSHRQFTHPVKPGRVTLAGKPSTDLHPKTQGEHPSAGRITTVTDFAEPSSRYLILIEGGPPSNYSAWSPDLPGCGATGGTIEEAEREMRAAIALHLEGLAHDAVEIPEPSGPGVYVERTTQTAA